MHGQSAPVQAKQGRREDGADVWILNSTVVRFLGRVQSEKKIFLVTKGIRQ
jgi:hypothetical protein